ncbi:MAG: DUF4177 domain-containing protein [Tissierellia bacterium]|nr:DUF4177 domain-containing protein [Tissierellia bacterium]MDD4725368.1 DUF4177 domain-containing protein [Tissierellia bacterium]
MYVYEYERISSNLTGWGFSGDKYETEEYKEIINKRAAEGWRYVGFIPALQRGTGHIQAMDLVFEREQ